MNFDVILRNGQDRSLSTKCILQGRAGACPRRFRPLREGAVKCKAFDWGRDFFISLPPPFASGKSHLPLRGRGYGAPSRRPLRTHCIFIFQSERSRPFPTIFHYSFFIIHPFSGRRDADPYARITVCLFRNSRQTPRREQAPALPCKMHFVRRPQKRCNLFRVVEVTAAPLPLCRCATFPLTGESHRPLRTK